MTRKDVTMLDANDAFPEINLQTISGEKLKLPEATGEGYGVVLIYRGYWWPFCNQQLADFQSSIKGFESEQVKLIAGSVDPMDKARETAEKSGITYPVAYGMDVEEISEITGAFYDNERKYLHATGYLIRPDNTIEVACYSTGPIGRFVPKDTLMLVKYYKSRK